MAREGRVVREGVVAGLIGAAAVAILILVFDIAGGAPLQSPAILGSLIFKGVRDPTQVTVSAGLVLGYTIVHGLGFIVVGVIAAALVAAAERERAMVLALLIFFAAFDVSFIALVASWALPVLGVLTWWEILAGNLVASAAMLYYFHRRHPDLARSLIGGWVDVVREGIVAGIFGGAVVAVWFYVYDTIRLQPFHTPALLGATMLQGRRDPALLTQPWDVILGYTVFHFAVFALFGIAVAACLFAAEREPRILLGLLILFLCFQIFFFGLLQALDVHLAGALPWWNVAIGNLLASVAMVTYFFLSHRSLGARLLERWTED
jgi:hypothetical protein